MYNEIIYNGEWVLINAYFYKFWMHRSEFEKYKTNYVKKY